MEQTGTAVPSSLDPVTPDAPAKAPEAPAAAPAVQTPEKAPFDATAFEAKLKEYDPDITLDNLPSHLKKLRKTNTEYGRKMAEYEKNNAPRDAFFQLVDGNEALRQRISTVIDEFSAENPSGAPSAPSLGTLHLEERLNRIEMENLVRRTEAEIGRLETQGYPVNDEMRDSIHEAVLNSGGRLSADEVYGQQNWRTIVAFERKKAAEDAVAALKINNDAYTPVAPQRGQAAPSEAPPVDVSKMDPAQFYKHALDRISKTMGGA